MRQEFGFQRTTCSCKKCSLWCEYVPGSLVPSDLDRLIPPGENPFVWAEQHLLASLGLQIKTPHFTMSIPSLGPRRQENGHCHWLQDGRCTVHENSPYGCAFLGECGMTDAHAAKVVRAGRDARAKAFQENGLYARIWQHLWDKGLREQANLENRKRAGEAVDENGDPISDSHEIVAKFEQAAKTKHAGTHVREAFQDFLNTDTNTVDVDGEEVWLDWFVERLTDCTDILPAGYCSDLDLPQGSTYGDAVAHLAKGNNK